MPSEMKKHFWIISLLSILSLLIWVIVSLDRGTVGFPLDDGWIHQTYARNLARGEGWTYVPGQPSAGATAPLWVLLLVPGYWLGGSPVCWVLLLGLLQVWGLAWLSYRCWPYLSRHGGWWLVAAGLVIGLEWHLLWAALSGMETLLMAVLIFGVLAGLLRLEMDYSSMGGGGSEKWWWFGLGGMVGLGIWVRPEAVTLLGPVLFVSLLMQAESLRRQFNAVDRHVWTAHSLGSLKDQNSRDQPLEVRRALKFCERRSHERTVCGRTRMFVATSGSLPESRPC